MLLYNAVLGEVYIHIGVGFGVVCFEFYGQCESLDAWNGQQRFTLFLCPYYPSRSSVVGSKGFYRNVCVYRCCHTRKGQSHSQHRTCIRCPPRSTSVSFSACKCTKRGVHQKHPFPKDNKQWLFNDQGALRIISAPPSPFTSHHSSISSLVKRSTFNIQRSSFNVKQ